MSSKLGVLTEESCGNSVSDGARYILNGRVIYHSRAPLMFEWSDDDKKDGKTKIYIFSTGDYDKKTKCSDRIVLIDFLSKTPRVFNFGVKGSCHKFKSASYRNGALRIKLENNLNFNYRDGAFKLPERGVELFEDGLFNSPWYSPKSEDELIPYADEYKNK